MIMLTFFRWGFITNTTLAERIDPGLITATLQGARERLTKYVVLHLLIMKLTPVCTA